MKDPSMEPKLGVYSTQNSRQAIHMFSASRKNAARPSGRMLFHRSGIRRIDALPALWIQLERRHTDFAKVDDGLVIMMLEGDVAGFGPRAALRLPRAHPIGHSGYAVVIRHQNAVQPYDGAQAIQRN